MLNYCLHWLALAVALSSIPAWAQAPGVPETPGEKVDGDAALNRALKVSSLTFEGKPFHAAMEIETAGEPFSGRVEVWWVNASKYHVAVTSPKFSQVKTVNGDRVQEKNDGDYYPRWLESFLLAVLDPVPMAKNLRERGDTVVLGAQSAHSCLKRDDRRDGITDEVTFGQVCFLGSEPRVGYVRAFNDFMAFSDWRDFGEKQIPRTYETRVLDSDPVIGRLTVLEELNQPDEAMFTVDSVTPVDQRISTVFVSTVKGESLIEKAPVIQWPTVREGNVEGFMTVYARTDRTGQVREVSRHNADQKPALAGFGMQQALNYKFKPLVVDGVPQQMEMPLVLHFSTSIADPIPILTVADMARQTISCKPSSISPGLLPKGTVVAIRVSVNEAGNTVGVSPVGRCPVGCGLLAGPIVSINKCKFAPYTVNGHATFYKGDVELIAP
jgi:hypothetical protein